MSYPVPPFVQHEAAANFAIEKKPPGVARAICVPGEIRLPRSASVRRSDYTFLKLLDRVGEHTGGSAFEGRILRPGATFREKDLPDPAVLLECAGTEGRRREKGGTAECRYIIWRWDKIMREWCDLAQASSEHGEWAYALQGVARRALNPEEAVRVFDCARSVDRVLSFLETELYGMNAKLRVRVLENLYGRIAGLVAA
jgi:hypothetical protein